MVFRCRLMSSVCILYTPAHTNTHKSCFREGLRVFSTRGNSHPLSHQNNRLCPGQLISSETGGTPQDVIPHKGPMLMKRHYWSDVLDCTRAEGT